MVQSSADFDRVRKGDVVVSHTASPELADLLDRAGAVITDVGGVLSHVVVVALGLGIPVVVATGTATTDLHDGWLVAVDGTTGSVQVKSRYPVR